MRILPLRLRAAALACLVPLAALPSSAADSGLWAGLRHDDPVVFARNLRDAGFPADVVGLLVSQEVGRRFAARERALQPSVNSPEGLRAFWSPERRAVWFQLRKEKNDLLRDALGVAPDVQARMDWVAAQYPQLDAPSRDEVRRITEDYDQLVQDVVASSRGHFTEGDRGVIEYLEGERMKDLGRVLSADDIVDYQVKRSRFGSLLRHQLQSFEPTPEEVRTYYQVAVKHGLHVQVFNSALGGSERSAAQRAVDEELAGLWTAGRMQDLRRSRSPYHRRIQSLCARLGQPRETAARVYAAMESLMTELSLLTPTPPPDFGRTSAPRVEAAPAPPRSHLTMEERKARQQTLLDRHIAEIKELLGEAGYAEYRTLNEDWLRRLEGGTLMILRL